MGADRRSSKPFQEEVARYLHWLSETFHASDNYTSLEVQAENRRLVLRGVGEPTPRVAEIMAKAPRDVEVEWRPVPYTSQELQDESLALLRRFPRLTGGGPRWDGTCIQMTTTDARLLSDPDPQTTLSSRYPVSVVHGEPVTPA